MPFSFIVIHPFFEGALMQTSQPPRRPSFIEEAELSDDAPSTQSKIAAPVSIAGGERALLVMLSGLNAGQVFALDRDETVIGRSRSADIRVDDGGVSRKNTRIVRSGAGFFVEDLGSRNGTFKNGERIHRSQLSSGDRVHIGPTLAMRFSVVDQAEEELARQLYEASTRDTLTHAYNRRYFVQRLASEVAFAQRHHTKVAVIILDVDHFKRVNDTWGHRAGDEVLKTITMAMQGAIRTEDVFARYGGEEFAVLVRGIDHRRAAAFAERLRQTVSRIEISLAETALRVTVSAGVASLDPETKTGEDLMLMADERLYLAKSGGRNAVSA
jgi:diguanylate cyclase (GGDEF)-like protein